MSAITITDLAGAIYSAGTVFDGLAAGRLDTENFLRSGSLAGVSSRSDLSLLADQRGVAPLIIAHHPQPIAPADGCAAKQTGVRPRYGQHTPPAMTEADLEHLIASLTCDDAAEYALDLFVHLAKAQPFEDGNKRTALFVANSLLIGDGRMLVVPVDDNDSQLSDTFNDLLAKAYLRDEHDAVKDLMRRYGLVEIPDHRDASEGP